MLNFAQRTLLVASVALTATSVAAVPTIPSTLQGWDYWTSKSIDVDFGSKAWTCSSEVARIEGSNNADPYFLHRAHAGSDCVSEPLLEDGPNEVVLFKQEAIVDETKSLTSSWKVALLIRFHEPCRPKQSRTK